MLVVLGRIIRGDQSIAYRIVGGAGVDERRKATKQSFFGSPGDLASLASLVRPLETGPAGAKEPRLAWWAVGRVCYEAIWRHVIRVQLDKCWRRA